MGLTARTSLRVGLFAALGVATADGAYASVAVFGGAALTGVIAPVASPLGWLSVFVLIAVGLRVAGAAIRAYRRDQVPPPEAAAPVTAVRAYTGLLGLTLINPVAVIYFTALVMVDRSGATASAAQRILFVLAAFTSSASWQAFLAGSGALLGRALTGRRGRLVTALASSIVIGLLAAHLALTR